LKIDGDDHVFLFDTDSAAGFEETAASLISVLREMKWALSYVWQLS
jgi:hypothetical protein